MKAVLFASLLLALLAPSMTRAQQADTIRALRAELEQLRASYQVRIDALEQKLRAAEAAAPTGVSPVPAAPTLAPTAASTAPAAPASATMSTARPAAPVSAAPAVNAFNPAISLILSGTFARSSQDPANYRIDGFAAPADAELGPGFRGLSLGESELFIAASIDPWWRGVAMIALAPDNSVAIEEAFVQSTAFGQGLGFKAGRFLSGIGYLNQQHRHVQDFVDIPLAYQAMFAGQVGEDGVQLRWLAPTDLLFELGAELGRGNSFPAAAQDRSRPAMRAIHAHLGGDIGDNHSWRGGLSLLKADAAGQQLMFGALDSPQSELAFDGQTRVLIADLVWKWTADDARTGLKLQGEYLQSRRNGLAQEAVASAPWAISARQSGWYLQGVYQFMPRWRTGLRVDRLDPAGAWGPQADAPEHRPRRLSAMLDFSPSEFSRWRVQLAQDRARAGIVDNQLFLQYQMLLGAHPAHRF